MPAQADVIDFEGYFGPTAHGEYIQSAGYNLGFFSNVAGAMPGDLAGSFLDGSDSQSCDANTACPVNNPSTYYGALNDSYIHLMSGAPRTRFGINGFDASFIGGTAALGSYPAMAGAVQIQGIRADGSVAVETYILAGPSNVGFNFAHFDTSAAFRSNAFIEAYVLGIVCDGGGCTAFSNDRAQFGMDNLDLTEVPEPASFLLFGIGMLGLGAVARRRRTSL